MNQRRYKPTLDREQRLLLPERVEDYVGENHQVRALDAYVDTLDLAALGFKHTETGTVAGQPPYNPWALLKLYLYGYQHGIRSRRYSLDEFTYDAEGDRYYCPQGKRLTPCRKPVVRSGK